MEKTSTQIRLTLSNKIRLDKIKGTKIYNDIIGDMLTYFEKTGYNPVYHSTNPNSKIERRIEDLFKVIRVCERDYFKPLMEKEGRGESQDCSQKIIRLSNEKSQLEKKLEQLQHDANADSLIYKEKLEDLVSLIKDTCDVSNFNTSAFGNDLKVPKSFFEKLIQKIENEYVL